MTCYYFLQSCMLDLIFDILTYIFALRFQQIYQIQPTSSQYQNINQPKNIQMKFIRNLRKLQRVSNVIITWPFKFYINSLKMQGKFSKLVKWIKAPLQLELDKPFLKASPLKLLDNNKILFQVDTGNGNKQIPIPIHDSFQASTEGRVFDDMCHMNVLNEPQVLNNLVQRYKKDKICTYIGPTLIIVNPYKKLPQYFGQQSMLKARQKILDANLESDQPHVYMIAGQAYLHMKSSESKQVIVISGQSGAGKTQSTKYCMKILTSLSHFQTTPTKAQHSVEQIILSCNPLLQAFGNSKTVRNDNSSRFGKYVQMYFGQDDSIKGASIQSYLLQKSRVVSVSQGQRSFHAFYALIASRKFNTKQAKQYKFLKSSNCYQAAGVDDACNFKQISMAMQSIGFEQSSQNKIWLLLKAILELGNIQFDDEKHQLNQQHPCRVVNKQLLKPIAETLQVSVEQLQKMLVFERKVMLGQVMHKAYKGQGCNGHRNTLCKAIYNAVFQFILDRIQYKLKPQKMCGLKPISILDIFGFQNFQKNSFQQLCINFTNQKLLRLYNQYIFKRQMQLLSEDGLGQRIGNIKPPTNDGIINMINGPGVSIFSLINDNTLQQQCSDQNIKAVIKQRIGSSNPIKFNQKKPLFFTIAHSQCLVEYDIAGFKMKNLDKVNDDVLQILSNLKMIKSQKKQSSQPSGRTLLKKFSSEIQSLMGQLSTSKVHFIRCIKPNQTKKANSPVQGYILSQVRYLGVFQTIQIRKKTFPIRKDYHQFTHQYKMMFPQSISNQHNLRKLTEAILKDLKTRQDQYMLGHKRVYINQRVQGVLNAKLFQFLEKRNQHLKKVKDVCRRFLLRSKLSRNLRRISCCSKLFRTTGKLELKFRQSLKKQIFTSLCRYVQHLKEQQKRGKQAGQLKAKTQNQLSKKGIKNTQQRLTKVTQQKVSGNKSSTNAARLKRLQQINQKFFKYSRPIIKASTKLSLGRYFQRMRLVCSVQNKPGKSSLNCDEALNQFFFVQPVSQQNPNIFKLKNPVPKPLTIQSSLVNEYHKFSESFYNQQSVYISPGAQMIFTGNLKIPIYQNTKQTRQKLLKLKTILAQKFKSFNHPQSQSCSPHSQDSNFKLEDTPQDIMNKVINFPVDDFFQRVLKRRTGLFGMKKHYAEILTYKPRPLTKTLTELPTSQQAEALKIFKLLLKIGQQTLLDNVFKLVDNVMRYCQQTSQSFKNQVFLQMIKQSNNELQIPAIRIYQTFPVFLHIYTPDEDFLYAGLYLFLNKIAQKKQTQKENEFLKYLYRKILRKIQTPHSVGYIPIKYQIMALMSKRQISIPIYLPIGSNVLVKAESYETFADIKTKVLREFGINIQRIPPQFFGFFEVVNYQNTQLQQSPVNQNSIIWDIMTYWEMAKQKYHQTRVPAPYFSILIKVKFPFQCSYDDQETIQLYFAQCYFDYQIGRIRLQLRQMGMLAACIKKIRLVHQQRDNIDGYFPLWLSKLYDKETFKKCYTQNLEWLQGNHLDDLSIKYKFLQVCSESHLALTFAIPTEHSIKLFMKPKRIYLVDKGSVVGQFSIREIAKWSNNNQSFNFQIKRKDATIQSKTQTIPNQYPHLCTDYLNKVSQYLLKYGGRNTRTQAKILKGI